MSLLESVSHSTSFVSEDTLLEEVAILISGSEPGVVGVTRDGQPVGTISRYDLQTDAIALGHDLSRFSAKHIMRRRPITIEWPTDDLNLIDAAINMQRSQALHAVVTKNGVPAGLISYGALMRYNLND